MPFKRKEVSNLRHEMEAATLTTTTPGRLAPLEPDVWVAGAQGAMLGMAVVAVGEIEPQKMRIIGAQRRASDFAA